MNAVHEQVLTFACAGDLLVGVLALPSTPPTTGVLIVVGGPQYRSGSHRQFVQIARALASGGFAVLRFDYRGMGDSEGAARTFEDVDEDLSAAITAFQQSVPSLRRVVLLGLCDGASAALLYWDRRGPDARAGGLCLLNPWARTAAGQAATTVRHHYKERLKSREFWRRLLTGKVAFPAARDAFTALYRMLWATKPRVTPAAMPYVERMARAAQSFAGPVLLVTSGRDFTAQEFMLMAAGDVRWRAALARPTTCHVDLPQADHTFSDPQQQRHLQERCLTWLRGLTSEGAHAS